MIQNSFDFEITASRTRNLEVRHCNDEGDNLYCQKFIVSHKKNGQCQRWIKVLLIWSARDQQHQSRFPHRIRIFQAQLQSGTLQIVGETKCRIVSCKVWGWNDPSDK
jgi:hypothetical protein